MLHTLNNKIQRVSDLVTEYDKDEDRCRNPNPALHGFVQKLKVILSVKTEITINDGNNCSNSGSNTDDIASRSSSSSSSQISDCDSNTNPKVAEALRNHVVLTEVFKCGSFRDLKNFRLINKQWKGIANSAIIRRRLFKLSMNKLFRVSDSPRISPNALLELISCIEESKGSFPLTALDFTDMDYYNCLDSPALLRFYAVMGPSIKQIVFDNFGSLSVSEFQDLLVNKMPNVDHIDAGNICFTNQEEYSVKMVLPYLKTVRFLENYDDETDELLVLPHYKDLLFAATNLKEIVDFQIPLMNIVIETEKVDCIQSFTFDLQSDTAMSAQFSHTEPKLTSLLITRLHLDDNMEMALLSEISQSLTRILISSKDTLKHLQCLPRLFSVNFELPKFPNLEFLTVYDDSFLRPGSGQVPPPGVFPAGCDISEIFPSLHTVFFDTLLWRGESLCSYFPDQAFPSVKTLAFKRSFQLGSSLTTNFPNVCHIKIINFERIMFLTEELSPFGGFHYELDSQIESVEISQCVLAHSGREFQLDSLFTGVPTHLCARLLEMHIKCVASGDDENSSFVERLLEVAQTQNYMFRNSEGLRRLKIIFNDSKNSSFRITRTRNSDSDVDSAHEIGNKNFEPLTPFISPISCIYGFSLMPNLEEVIIGYDHNLSNASDIAQVLEPLAQFPYVKIVHEPTVEDQ